MRTDGVFRNVLVSGLETEGHPDVRTGLAAKRDRSLARGGHDLQETLSLLHEVDVVTPAGIYVRRDLAFDLNQPMFHEFAERLIRALLAHEFRQPYFDATIGWRLSPPLPDMAYAGLAKFGKVRKVHDVFAYGVMAFGHNGSAWAVANFFGSVEMFIRAHKRGSPQNV